MLLKVWRGFYTVISSITSWLIELLDFCHPLCLCLHRCFLSLRSSCEVCYHGVSRGTRRRGFVHKRRRRGQEDEVGSGAELGQHEAGTNAELPNISFVHLRSTESVWGIPPVAYLPIWKWLGNFSLNMILFHSHISSWRLPTYKPSQEGYSKPNFELHFTKYSFIS